MSCLDPTAVLAGEIFPWLFDSVPEGSRAVPVGRGTAFREPSALRSLCSLRPLTSLGSLLSQRWAHWALTGESFPALQPALGIRTVSRTTG
jgi:hypothetical protein